MPQPADPIYGSLIQAHLLEAREALSVRDLPRALQILGAVLASEPGHLEAELLRIHAQKFSGESGAEQALDALVGELEAGLPSTAPLLVEALRLRILLNLESERTTEALLDMERALQLDPADGELLQAFATRLFRSGRRSEARARMEAAKATRADRADFWLGYGNLLQAEGARAEAEAAFRRAIQLEPDSVSNLLSLAQFLADGGRLPETAPLLERVLQLRPGFPAAVSGLLGTSLYDPARAPADLARLHRAWVETLEAKVEPMPLCPKDWDPERQLTVAYLSADFREHSCAAFIEPLLRAHDRGRFRIVLLPTVADRDARTDRLQAATDGWIEAWRLGDRELAERLQADGVDILVDLGGHTAFNRLPVLAHRPAPVQLEWLGYPFPTGLSRLQGRITDRAVDPSGSETKTGEALLRIDPCYLCWLPPAGGPDPVDPPSAGGEPFTFGSFNHFAKLHEGVVQVWAAILRRVPGARLFLKGKGSQDPVLRERILAGFEDDGVPRSRIRFEGWAGDTGSHLAHYRSVDLALDPFPYNGCTTSIEALWMGVPLVALQGVHSLSRHGLMILSQAGLAELAAATPADYVRIAVELAADPKRLAAIRRGLRERLLASPLCDARGFARRMEALYRDQWRLACARAQGGEGG